MLPGAVSAGGYDKVFSREQLEALPESASGNLPNTAPINSMVILSAQPENETGYWVDQGMETFSAGNYEDIRKLFGKWHYFRDEDPSKYAHVEITVFHARWVGASACAPGDARLSSENISYTLEPKKIIERDGSVSYQSATGGMTGMPVGDPCHI
jgi:hypothetical protein